MTNGDSDSTPGSEGADPTGEGTTPKEIETRITADDKIYLDKLIAVQKENELKEQEKAKAKELSQYDEKIKALEEENKLLKESRKKELLSFLDETDQKKYNSEEYSVEQLEVLVEWLKDHPPRKKGLTRKPTTTTTKDKRQLAPGVVGSYNYKTKEWE